jgi:predicted thioredoxin/glutaredoxin
VTLFITCSYIDYVGEEYLSVYGLAKHLEDQGFTVKIESDTLITIPHDNLPLYLAIEFRGNLVYMSIKHREDLREVLEEMRDSGEDVEEAVEEALGYLTNASLKARLWIEQRGLTPVFDLRRGSIEIYEILEDVLEEAEE